MVTSSGTTSRSRAVEAAPAHRSRWGFEPVLPGGSCAFRRIRAVRTSIVDSNSTRTESCVSIRPDPEAHARSTRRKPRITTDTNRSSVRTGRWGLGLKILCPVSLQGCYLDRVLQTAGRPSPIPIFPGDFQVHSHPILMRGDHWNQGPKRTARCEQP